VTIHMQKLLRQLFTIISNKCAAWNVASWHNDCVEPSWSRRPKVPKPWSSLSPRSWIIIFESLLLFMNEMCILECFGREKLVLHEQISQMRMLCDGTGLWDCNAPCARLSGHHPHRRNCEGMATSDRCKTCTANDTAKTYNAMAKKVAEAMKGSFKDGRFVPLEPSHYVESVNVTMPPTPIDTRHFGHTLWVYVKYRNGTASSLAHFSGIGSSARRNDGLLERRLSVKRQQSKANHTDAATSTSADGQPPQKKCRVTRKSLRTRK